MSDINSLLKDFDSISDEAWSSKITSDLKLENPLEALSKVDENGIKHLPYYRASSIKDEELIGKIQALQLKSSSWKYIQVFAADTPDLEKAIKQSLISGTDEVVISGVENVKELSKNFKNELKEISHLHLHLNNLEKNPTPKVIFCDPIGEMIRVNKTNNREMDALKELFQKRLNQLKPDNFLLVDGAIYKNAGATVVQELALVMQHAVEYLDQMTDAGYTAEAIARSFTFRLGIGLDYFTEIAKLRAFRYLIQKVFSTYEVETSVRIWGEASNYYHAHKEPYTNLLRSTTQAMAAVIGNCDLISIPAFDALEKSSELGQRMARNTSLILKNESHFNKVNDLAKGSYYIEQLSADLAEKTWELFLKYEAEGSFYEDINSGEIKKKIAIEHQARVDQYKKEEKIMVGVNKYQTKDTLALNIESGKGDTDASIFLSKDISQ